GFSARILLVFSLLGWAVRQQVSEAEAGAGVGRTETHAKMGSRLGPAAVRRLVGVGCGSAPRAGTATAAAAAAGREAEVRAVQFAEHQLHDGRERLGVRRLSGDIDVLAADLRPVPIIEPLVIPVGAHGPPAGVEDGGVLGGDVDNLQRLEGVGRTGAGAFGRAGRRCRRRGRAAATAAATAGPTAPAPGSRWRRGRR